MALKSLSTAELRREIERRERGATKIAVRRDKLAKALAALDRELADLGVDGAPRRGRPPGSKNKRRGRKPGPKAGRRTGRRPGRPAGRKLPRNKVTLADALAGAVKPGQVVSPADAGKLVKARGYKTTARTFGVAVAQALARHKGFKRKGHGQYERVGGAGAKAAKPKARPSRKPKPKGHRGMPKRSGRRAPSGRSKGTPAATAAPAAT